ncbi:uncharacterized protein CANTADRAFT_48608 [Suhomyces tanzawaensis NRRL Y-17324]|uniref:Uncharacterized protein n=1 Tax=Suhomyces tanzawaensis NRRL Y-17324 TaxID=984487 RepID=A0A1E4SLK4_9ASCO|nr:uncharacterized protein CANTADRAFT_48608 [Suhomyces tanzawaensis NRRL Y-17324]ODV80380.1 hypothetical protein CANTADRAFT_48608 [Suhomyces tanzawaensis NRRL Y-17324]
MSDYPAFVDSKPPVITLEKYDVAPWAGTTCIDFRNNDYVVVVMETPDKVVARIDAKDHEVLQRIFRSAHATHAQQSKK